MRKRLTILTLLAATAAFFAAQATQHASKGPGIERERSMARLFAETPSSGQHNTTLEQVVQNTIDSLDASQRLGLSPQHRAALEDVVSFFLEEDEQRKVRQAALIKEAARQRIAAGSSILLGEDGRIPRPEFSLYSHVENDGDTTRFVSFEAGELPEVDFLRFERRTLHDIFLAELQSWQSSL